MKGQYRSTPVTLSDGDIEIPALGETGALKVEVVSGGGGGGGGDASAANQLTQIGHEAAIEVAVESIDGKTPALNSGRVPVLSDLRVAGSDVSLSNPIPVGVVVGTLDANVTGTVTANLGTLGGAATASNQATANASLSSIDGKLPPLGAATISGSVPVNIASNQTVPISGTVAISTVSQLPPALGALGSSSSLSVVPATDGLFQIDGTNQQNPIYVDFNSTPSVNQGVDNGAPGQAWYMRLVDPSTLQTAKVYAGGAVVNPVVDTAIATRNIESLRVGGSAVANANPIPVSDANGSLTVDGTVAVSNFPATQAISAASLPLPTGAATSANQSTANTSLASIDAKTPALVSGRQPVDGSGVTQPISAASLPLPTGASTAANQTTANTSLASIDSKTPVLVSGWQPTIEQIPSDATTSVWSNLFGATSGGGAVVKASPGRLRYLRVVYTGATTSGLWVQLHNATTVAGASSATLLESGFTINSTNPDLYLNISEQLACSTGIVVLFSTAQNTTTLAAAETGFVTARYK